MKETRGVRRREKGSVLLPAYVHHKSFSSPGAVREYDPKSPMAFDPESSFMPDDVTRDHARRMHYAAHRMDEATRSSELRLWQSHYNRLRDAIILGNRKLIYRAVKRRMADHRTSDDLIGDCHIVLIQAVAVYNPWMGIRFSTYAYTCLIRAMSRIAQKSHRDWLGRAVGFDVFHDGEPGQLFEDELSTVSEYRIDEFLREDHPLLTTREKRVISRRFRFESLSANPTLETVGRTLGLSKERVRQVQAIAIEKLRIALTETAAV